MAKRNEARREEMRRLIAEQEASGKSLAAFARERGIPRWTLYNWKQRLASREGTGRRSEFVEVKVSRQPAAAVMIAVELGPPVRLQVPRGFEEDHLRRLIGVLSSC